MLALNFLYKKRFIIKKYLALAGLQMVFAATVAATEIKPIIGLPPAPDRPLYNVAVANPDMNDNFPVIGIGGNKGDMTPDSWTTNGPIQVKNIQGTGVTSLIQGGVLSQTLNAPTGTSFNAFWVTLLYRITPFSDGTQIIYPALDLTWVYLGLNGSVESDHYRVTSEHAAKNPDPNFTQLDFWGLLKKGTTPTSIKFTAAMAGLGNSSMDINYLNFRTGYVPEPESPALLLIAISIAAIVSRLQPARRLG